MTESDERLDTLSDKIDEAEGAAKSLSEQDVIDPDPVEGELPDSVEEATGRAETGREEISRDETRSDPTRSDASRSDSTGSADGPNRTS